MSFVRAQFVLPQSAAPMPAATAATLGCMGCPPARRQALGCGAQCAGGILDRRLRLVRPPEPVRRPQNLRGLGFSFPWATLIGAGTGAAVDILRSQGSSTPAPPPSTPYTYDANGNYVVPAASSSNVTQQIESAVQQGIQAAVQPGGNIVPATYTTTGQPAGVPTAAPPAATSSQLIPGVSNTTLAIGAAVGAAGLMLMLSKRR